MLISLDLCQILLAVYMQCLNHRPVNLLAELRRFCTMQLDKIQPDLLYSSIDKIGIFVHENTNQVGTRLSFGRGDIPLTGLQERADLLWPDITVAWLIENEAEHICSRFYGGIDVFRLA